MSYGGVSLGLHLLQLLLGLLSRLLQLADLIKLQFQIGLLLGRLHHVKEAGLPKFDGQLLFEHPVDAVGQLCKPIPLLDDGIFQPADAPLAELGQLYFSNSYFLSCSVATAWLG